MNLTRLQLQEGRRGEKRTGGDEGCSRQMGCHKSWTGEEEEGVR